jgi:hypothetical protein
MLNPASLSGHAVIDMISGIYGTVLLHTIYDRTRRVRYNFRPFWFLKMSNSILHQSVHGFI